LINKTGVKKILCQLYGWRWRNYYFENWRD